MDECFPPENPLSKIFNRKSVKISYSTTPNMEQIITGKNTRVLNNQTEDPNLKRCNCTKEECPLDGKCQERSLVYQATVQGENSNVKTYIGLTGSKFKARHAVHKKSFDDPECQTKLSRHIHQLKEKGINPKVTWKIVEKGTTYSPVSGVCQLCIKEAYYIIFEPTMAELNSRSELFSTCRHKKSILLVKEKVKKRKSPGT